MRALAREASFAHGVLGIMTIENALSYPQKSTTVRANSRPAAPSVPLGAKAIRLGLGALSALSPAAAGFAAERLFMHPRRHARPDHEWALLSSARMFSIPNPDGAVTAWEWGDDGEPVLLMHGWEGRGAQLGSLVAPLVARGFRVVTLDAPAHGSSPGFLSSFFHFARALESAKAEVGPFRAVIAHSLGGAAAAWASQSSALGERLVMIAAPTDLRDATEEAAQMLGLRRDARERMEARLTRRFGMTLDDVHAARVAPQMTAPALVVHDENDREVPIASGELLARVWPGAELVRTRGLGHRRILKDPAVISRIVSFVASPRAA
jgi:pimeloyl-ACP methyl ester carboxylesterase